MRAPATRILGPDDRALDELCQHLAALAARPGADAIWPKAQLDLCRSYGVFEWFVSAEWGGQGWRDVDVIRAYLRLSSACLLTAFVLTQRTGACRRIGLSENDWARSQLLPRLLRGEVFATLGVSHLTTSRRHLSQPVLRARATSGGYVLDGYTPWVTGARHAEYVVVGAALGDGQQILVALPTSLPGVVIGDDLDLVALSGSATAEVRCDGVLVPREWLLNGPSANVVRQGLGARTGGLQTTTLALGLATQAIEFMAAEGANRPVVAETAARLRRRLDAEVAGLLRAAAGGPADEPGALRLRADALVLEATRAALAAAKGSGFLRGHPAGRWAQQALFFLVWSVPNAVIDAELERIAVDDP